MIKLFLFIISLSYCFSQENLDGLSIDVNQRYGMFDHRDWIVLKNGNEITEQEFYHLVDRNDLSDKYNKYISSKNYSIIKSYYRITKQNEKLNNYKFSIEKCSLAS